MTDTCPSCTRSPILLVVPQIQSFRSFFGLEVFDMDPLVEFVEGKRRMSRPVSKS